MQYSQNRETLRSGCVEAPLHAEARGGLVVVLLGPSWGSRGEARGGEGLFWGRGRISICTYTTRKRRKIVAMFNCRQNNAYTFVTVKQSII